MLGKVEEVDFHMLCLRSEFGPSLDVQLALIKGQNSKRDVSTFSTPKSSTLELGW